MYKYILHIKKIPLATVVRESKIKSDTELAKHTFQKQYHNVMLWICAASMY